MKWSLILFLLIANSSYAQTPWRAKLFIHFDGSNGNQNIIDTLWFGCDSLGNEGFQPGLDELDTVLKLDKGYFYDAVTQSQLGLETPYNLKTNIKAFNKNGIVKYNIQTVGGVIRIGWDSTDYIYDQPDFKLYYAELQCSNCYLQDFDRDYHMILGRRNEERFFSTANPINVFQGYDMNLDITITFRDISRVGLNDFEEDKINIYPNPASDNLFISDLNRSVLKIALYNLVGELIYSKTVVILMS